MKMRLFDSFGRMHTYLRMSLTEKCNLRCTYCMPLNGVKLTERNDLLSVRERKILLQLFYENGVRKFRFTGGEPTVSNQLIDLISFTRNLSDHKSHSENVQIGITTNGIRLSSTYIQSLVDSGLNSINISLDTLSSKTFSTITRREKYDLSAIVKAIYTCLHFGLKVKLNIVLMKGVNDTELSDFLEFFKEDNIDIRFIELMPFDGNEWNKDKYMSYSDAILLLRGLGYDLQPLYSQPSTTTTPTTITTTTTTTTTATTGTTSATKKSFKDTTMIDHNNGNDNNINHLTSSSSNDSSYNTYNPSTVTNKYNNNGDNINHHTSSSNDNNHHSLSSHISLYDPHDTTKWYAIHGYRGRIGFITTMSDQFCGGCNRLRITADGKLKICLFGDESLSLRDLLRSNNNNTSTNSSSSILSSSATAAVSLSTITSAGDDNPVIDKFNTSGLDTNTHDITVEIPQNHTQSPVCRYQHYQELYNISPSQIIYIEDRIRKTLWNKHEKLGGSQSVEELIHTMNRPMILIGG